MKLLIYSILIVFFLFCTSSADTLNVTSQYATIQSAINAASNGDVVLVASGTYYENINFKGKKITVASHYFINGNDSYIENTIIDGSQHTNPDSGSVVYFVSNEDTNSVLCGFTIRGGTGTRSTYPGNFVERDGGGILIKYAGGKIEHNIISQNILQSALEYQFGAGIAAAGSFNDYIIIRFNQIQNNTINGIKAFGAGAGLSTKMHILFEKNIVSGNSINATNRAFGGGIMVDGHFDCYGINNLDGNFIFNNEVKCSDNANAMGGGICIYIAESVMTNNIVHSNESEGNGGGITINNTDYAMPSTSPVLINNTICQNTAPNGGGIYIRGDNTYPIGFNSIVWDNAGSQISGVTGNFTVRYSDIQGGFNGQGNIDNQPCFCDTIYHLNDTSCCIGAGIDSIEIGGSWYYAPKFDFNGNPRPMCCGSMPDMGAQESRFPLTGINDKESKLPKAFILKQNYPNPFNPSTIIGFSLPRSNEVKIEIFNLLGQKIKTLLNKQMPSGSHEIEFTAKNLPSGVYLYKIEVANYVNIKKMIFMK